MSLLMEALKKAEEAKRQAGGAEPPQLPDTDVASEQVLSALSAEQQKEALPELEFSGLPPLQPVAEPAAESVTVPLPTVSAEPLATVTATERTSAPPLREQSAMGRPPAFELEAVDRPAPLAAPRAIAEHAPAAAVRHGAFRETASPAAIRPATANETPAEERQAAQNLFQAKQAPNSEPRKRKLFLIGVGLFALIGVAGIGVYFWLQLQPKNGLVLTANINDPAPVRPLPPSPAPQAPLATQPVSPPVQVSSAPIPPVAPIGSTAPAASAPLPTPVTAAPPAQLAPDGLPTRQRIQDKKVDGEFSLAAGSARETTKSSSATRQVPVPDSPIRITSSKQRLDPALERGFDAFQRGDLPAARTAYETALRNDANNVDGLNGLAMSYLRSGRNDLAEPLFQRVLEIDPRNSLAQAALTGLRDPSDPVQMESRLKVALADQPDAPHLYFSLGNLYARQNRWSDAQQAYFRAMSGDPDNPDYLFNLAISLDRLHQAKLARQYYEQALAAGERRPSGFDRNLASDRIRKLQP